MIENSYKMSNFFLESIISNNKDKIYINDISRIAYINNSGEEDNIILKQQLDKEENKIINPIINYKETFKERNDRINSLNEEILKLKQNNNKKEKDNKIKINIVQLKEILINRLKTYHENHINELINKYDLNHKKEIDKSLMENILLKAIHL